MFKGIMYVTGKEGVGEGGGEGGGGGGGAQTPSVK